MQILQRGQGFQFHYDPIANNKVRSPRTYFHTIVKDRLLDFPPKVYTGPPHFNSESALINYLLETGAQGTVDLHGAADYLVGKIVVDHNGAPLRGCV